MASRQPASSARRSWRQSPTRTPSAAPTGSSKTPLRLLLALVVVGLFGGFVWLLWQPVKSEPPTHFVAILSGDSSLVSLSLPAILFEQETVAPLKDDKGADKSFVYTDLSLARQRDSASLTQAIGGLGVQPDDRLVIYVSAHGISDDGEPYLLAPDFDLRQPDRARYSAKELINALAKVKSETKLLVLDCSRLAALPRMGMMANEFVSLVEQLARETGDPTLWVMTAGGELETSPLGLAERRSILGGALVDGLRGDADEHDQGGNEDYAISLAELNDFVAARCASARTAAPAPRLVYCGPESESVSAEKQIVRSIQSYRAEAPPAPSPAKQGASGTPSKAAALQAPNPPAAPVAAPAAADNADANAERGANAGANASAPPAEPAADPAGAPTTAPPASAPAATSPAVAAPPATAAPPAGGQEPAKPAPIIQAWQLRDRLEPFSATPPSVPYPVDYAPHCWIELNAKLVELHLQRLGGALSGASAEELIKRHQAGLQRLSDGQGGAEGALVTDRLAAALGAYQDGAALKRLRSLPADYADALLDLRRYASRAHKYVQWNGAMLGLRGDAVPASAAARMADLLESLILLDQQLSALEANPPQAWEDAGRQLRDLGATRRQIREASSALDGHLAALVTSISGGADAVRQRYIEALLTTPLATAEQRQALTAALQRSAPASSSPPSAPSWSSIVQHLRLEFLLAQLVDPAMKDSPSLSAITSRAWNTTTPDPTERQLLRDAGQELRAFYEQAVGKIESSPATTAPQQSRATEKLLAIVHPRDASAALGQVSSSLGFVTPLLNPIPEFKLTSPPQLALRPGQWEKLTWTVDAQNVSDAQVEAAIVAVDEGIEVRFAGNRGPLRLNEPQTFRRGEPVMLEVRSLSVAEGSPESRIKKVRVKIRAKAESHERPFDSVATVIVPRPDRIQLTARCVQPNWNQPLQSDSCLRLLPFPNRNTSFIFELTNLSDEAKNLHVELISVPLATVLGNRVQVDGWPPGRVLDEQGRVASDLERWSGDGMPDGQIIAVADLALPADQRPRKLELKPPGGDAPAEAEKKEEAAGEAAPPEQPAPPSVDVTYGIVCRIVDKANPDAPTLNWLEVVPLRPTSYVEFRSEVVGREIRIFAKPIDADGDGQLDLPPGVLDKPVSITARGDDQVFSASFVTAMLAPSREETLITIQANDQISGPPVVALDVDGFPRAVAWRIDFQNQNPVRLTSLTSIQIEQLGMPDVDPARSRMYRNGRHVPVDEKLWPVIVDSIKPACAFDISKGARPMQVGLRIDAPLDAFDTIGGGNSVTLSWGEGGQSSIRLFDDRAVKSQVVEVTKTGELTIGTSVADVVLPLRPPGVNQTERLSARLAIQGAQEEVDSVAVVFDEARPKIAAVLKQQAIWEGTPEVDVQVDVDDISGVAKVEAWWFEKEPQREADLVPEAALNVPAPSGGPFQMGVREVRTLPLKLKAPAKENTYYLTLRVTDRSGQSASTLTAPMALYVRKPQPKVEGPIVADLKGVVMLKSKPGIDGLLVKAKENPALAATTTANGRFVIKGVKAGTYTLQVTGRAGSANVSGELEVTLEKRPDWESKANISAEAALVPPPKP